MSMPLFGKKYTFTQPDGSPLEVVGWGDQNHAVFEQADGEFALEHGRNDGDAGDLYAADTAATFGDTTQPGSRWWDGTSWGLQISQIAAAGNAMTFKV